MYVRALSRGLVALGHTVEVFSGPPYLELDGGTTGRGLDLTAVPSLDLHREPDPFRQPRLREFRSPVDVLEFALMCTAAFPEPLTFSTRRPDLEVIEDISLTTTSPWRPAADTSSCSFIEAEAEADLSDVRSP